MTADDQRSITVNVVMRGESVGLLEWIDRTSGWLAADTSSPGSCHLALIHQRLTFGNDHPPLRTVCDALMSSLALLFIHQPAHLLGMALVFFVAGGWLRVRRTATMPRGQALLWASLAWAAWAGWEAWVMHQTPEANIRVDLLLILPAVGLISIWSIVRTWLSRGARRQRAFDV